MRKTILFVDDALVFRDLGALFLARAGRVITAASGEKALALARSERPDLILVDLFMPDINGEEICRFIKTDPELSDIPVIVLVEVDDPQERARAVRAGADDILAKPVSRIILVEAVNRFLRDGGLRGVDRVPVEANVEFELEDQTHRGTLRNLSRGGLFLETDCEIPGRMEIPLRFVLPDSNEEFSPTAQVVWQSEVSSLPTPQGVGMRFVSIDGASVRTLEDYVVERTNETSQPAPM